MIGDWTRVERTHGLNGSTLWMDTANVGKERRDASLLSCTSIGASQRRAAHDFVRRQVITSTSSEHVKTKEQTTILALGKLGACATLPSIDLDSYLHLKILRRYSIENKERQTD